jgi:hypothetical protein
MNSGVPPPPTPAESLAGRGFRKKCLQNLDVKELRGQNLDNRALTGEAMRLPVERPLRHDRAF